MTNPEMIESQETGRRDDLKKEVKELRDELLPYREAYKKAENILDFIYKKDLKNSSERESFPYIWKRKSWKLKYKDNEWNECIIQMSTKRFWTPAKNRRSLSIIEWKKVVTLNWDVEQVNLTWSNHFYVTDGSWNTKEDYLEVWQINKVLQYIQWKVDEYKQISDKKLVQLMK